MKKCPTCGYVTSDENFEDSGDRCPACLDNSISYSTKIEMTTPTTPMETPTPETGKANKDLFKIYAPRSEIEVVHADFARKLERERDELSRLFQEERSLRRIEREAAASENARLTSIVEGQKARDEDYFKLVSENAALSGKLEEESRALNNLQILLDIGAGWQLFSHDFFFSKRTVREEISLISERIKNKGPALQINPLTTATKPNPFYVEALAKEQAKP